MRCQVASVSMLLLPSAFPAGNVKTHSMRGILATCAHGSRPPSHLAVLAAEL